MPQIITQDANAIVAKVQEMGAKHPPLLEALTAAWNRVCDKIETRAQAMRPKPRVFELRHEMSTARLALLRAVAEGRAPESGEIEALESVGLA